MGEEKSAQQKRRGARALVKNVVYVVVLLVLVAFLGTKGAVGFVLFVLVLTLWRVWKSRAQLVMILQYIETMLWGKPLERDMWEPGELKGLKRRIKFRRRKDDGKIRENKGQA